VLGLFRLCGWKAEDIHFEIVPLFETMTGMEGSDRIMDGLYRFAPYREHIARRGGQQTMMLGFSDGTKDGGYLKANWEIFKTKEKLTRVCGAHGIKALFFDGRGGPPARGVGATCRTCQRQACPARREPSILAGATGRDSGPNSGL
jgi:phosphoenolpyruvate carboxylase